MKFSWIAAAVTVLLWAVQAVLSIAEGTFSRRQWRHMHMSFLWNWAVSIGDLFIFPIVNGLLVPHLAVYWPGYPAALVAGGLASYIFHLSWWSNNLHLGHVFISWEASRGDPFLWMRDITKAGWIHFLYMTLQVAILGLYLFRPMDTKTVLLVGVLFTIFLGIQNLQAVVVQGARRPWAAKQFAWQTAVVVVITAAKCCCQL